MTDIVTAVTTSAELNTWYQGLPASGAWTAGDRYIAEIPNGNIDLTGLTLTGKAPTELGQIVLRPSADASKPNASNNAARWQGVVGAASSFPTLRSTFGGGATFGCTLAGGFVIEDIQFSAHQNGSQIFAGGTIVRRCAFMRSASGGSFASQGNASIRNCIAITNVAAAPAFAFQGSGVIEGNTLITLTDQAAFSISGSFNNSIWKSNVAINFAGATDPWPTNNNGSSQYYSASSNKNATSNASASSNMPPGTNVAAIASAAFNALSGSSTYDTINARPASGSTLIGAGAAVTETTDWYAQARSASTPTIGAVELVSSPAVLSGGITLDNAVASGSLASAPSDLSGGVTLDNAGASGDILSFSSALSGGVTLDNAVASGTLGQAPGVITIAAVKNWTGQLLANQLIENVVVIRRSDRALLVAFVNQVTNGAGDLVLSSVALAPATPCMVLAFNPDGSARGAWPATVT